MSDSLGQFRGQIGSYLSQLTTRQKISLFIAVAAGLAIILVIMVWTNAPRYEVLYSQLSQKDAGKIIEKLRERKIDYKLENGGATILVPDNKVYDLRLDFAREGLPENSMVGYEIFDKTNLGMTDFIQRINYRRALEGELTRTIEQLESVEKARVHIVIPEESLFKEDQKPVTASVILKLRGRGKLSAENVSAIVHLLASSVEGLEPEHVTVVDTRGRILSDQENTDNLIAMSTTQLEYKEKVEKYLSQKAQSMLDQVLGPGNAVVRVSADLNFKQVEKTVEQYDPDNTVVRSEEIQEQSTPVSGDNNNTGEKARTTNTVTNYEINKTIQHIVEDVGNITHLSVAVLVNNKKEKITGKDGNQQVKTIPRSPREIKTLEEIVKRAVGFRADRQDDISITNIDFSIPPLDEQLEPDDTGTPWSNWYNIIEKVFLVLAILISMLIMRSLFTQVRQKNDEIRTQLQQIEKAALKSLPMASSLQREQMLQNHSMGNEENEEDIIYAQEFFKLNRPQNAMAKAISNFVKQSPEEAAKLIKVWLLEDLGEEEKEEQSIGV